MVVTSNAITFTQQQIEQLAALHFINQIDEHLRIVSNINIVATAGNIPTRISLALEIYYDNNKFDTLQFNLHNYDYDDIVNIVSNIRANEFIMQAVDNFLAGDIE